MAHKGPGEARNYEASKLRVGILHSRWNAPIIESLVAGARKTLLAAGVQESNIITQTVPGAYELPFAVQRMYSASTSSQASGLVSAAADLLGGASSTDLTKTAGEGETNTNNGPLDAIIAIGVLIKGSTMHFEYIADAVSHGLMRVQLDLNVPVIFGVLTCLNEEQAYKRAGLQHPDSKPADPNASYAEQGHNHGEDWASAAVEMAAKRQGWGEGKFID